MSGPTGAKEWRQRTQMDVTLPSGNVARIRKIAVLEVFHDLGYLPKPPEADLKDHLRQKLEGDKAKAKTLADRLIMMGTVSPRIVEANPSEDELGIEDLAGDYGFLYVAIQNFSLGFREVAPSGFPEEPQETAGHVDGHRANGEGVRAASA